MKINGESCKALLDNSAQINTITPNYVRDHSLEMGLITDLIGTKVTCVGLGNAYTHSLGYVIIQIQVDGVQGYDEDQIALVVPDELKFVEWIPVILGTPTISHIVNIMKGREIDALAMPLDNTRVAHLLSVHRAMTMMVDDETAETASLNGYDEVVFMRNKETIDAFSSHVLPAKSKKAYMGECINIITQVLWIADDSLPQGLTVQNVYMGLQGGSKNVVMVVRNNTAYLKCSKRRPWWAGQWLQLQYQKHCQRQGSGRGSTDLRTLIHLLLGKGKASCLRN